MVVRMERRMEMVALSLHSILQSLNKEVIIRTITIIINSSSNLSNRLTIDMRKLKPKLNAVTIEDD